VIVVTGERAGLSSGQIGLLLGVIGAGVLAGSLASPLLRRRLSTRAVLVFELWMWLAPALFLVWPDVYVLTAAVLLPAFAIPVTNAVVIGYRLAITPDHVLGRVESVRTTIALLIAPLGPLVAGVLLTSSTRTTLAVFVALSLVLALWGTLSPAIRNAPRLDALRTNP
jgi:predicted MFS family arabinose efflux permease